MKSVVWRLYLYLVNPNFDVLAEDSVDVYETKAHCREIGFDLYRVAKLEGKTVLFECKAERATPATLKQAKEQR